MTNSILRRLFPAAAIFACWTGGASAQQAINAAQLPVKITLATRKIDVTPDGTSTITVHNETKILLPNAVTVFGQVPLSYSDLLQQIDITEAYTLKADGQKITVAPDAIITQQSPLSGNSPLLSDEKQKVIIFPNVEVGDTLVYTATTVTKPRIPGTFSYDTLMPSALPFDGADFTITIPKAMAPSIDSYRLNVAQSTQGDDVLYTLHYTNTNPTIPPQTQSAFDLSPRLSLSTFKNYDALAAAYAQLALPTIVVTPEIQAKADEITARVSERREQAKRIYDWVSQHVRYVALEFGQGGIVPHSADRVLANAYGDCKDHAVLFAALLKAKGIDSNLVLINGTNAYTLAKVPTLTPFNHVITWLPEFHLYADTTNGRFVPFGLLPQPEYGKPVLHIGDKAGASHRTPLTDPAVSKATYKLVITADEAGHISTNSSTTGTGDFAGVMRLLGAAMQTQDSARFAAALIQRSRTPHATGALTVPPPDASDPSYRISANYSTKEAISGLADDSGVLLQDSLKVVSPFSVAFFGPLVAGNDRDIDAVPCFNGHVVDDETLQYPATRHLTTLPADSKFSKTHVSYTSHWSTDGNSVSVHRELTTHFDQALCSGSAKDEMLGFADQLKTDTNILLHVPQVAATPPDPSPH